MASWPSTLPVPLQPGYEITPDDPLLRTQMAAGPDRVRRIATSAPERFAYVQRFSPTEMALFDAWFKWELLDGAMWFDVALAKGDRYQTMQARFTKPVKRVALSGMNWEVTSELEVRQPPVMSYDQYLGERYGYTVGGVRTALALLFDTDTGFSFDARVQFSRLSAASYLAADGLLTTAASGEARIGYRSGARRGLLVEVADTNSMINSADLAAALNTTSHAGGVVTANAAIAPDGTLSADNFQDTVTSGASGRIRTYTIAADAAVYVYSICVRKRTAQNGRFGLRLNFTGGTQQTVAVTCDAYSGVVVLKTGEGVGPTTENPLAYFSRDLGEYFRFFMVHQNNGTNTSLQVDLRAEVVSYASSAWGNAAIGGEDFWGVSLSSRVGSYIATAGTAVARAADVAVIDGAAFSAVWRATGTLFCEFTAPQYVIANSYVASVTDGTINNHISVLINTSGVAVLLVVIGGATVVQQTTAALIAGGINKIALSVTSTGYALSVNGGAVTVVAAAVPAALSQLNIGCAASYTAQLNEHIGKVLYYQTPLADANMMGLTA